jgi:pyruvate/2-oxoglutarate dehydrogenase complex dihydrolipoamide acyltransferase (E2) component
MAKYKIRKFPESRLATVDICAVGKSKHHVTGLIELDVTDSRRMIREYNRKNSENNREIGESNRAIGESNRENGDSKISFLAWMISVVGQTIKQHEEVSSFMKGRGRLMIFEDINVSMIVEKNLNGQRVPIPLLIEKADKISIESISRQINEAKEKQLDNNEIVLQKKADRIETLYYKLPGFLRRSVWRYLLKHPGLTYSKMGNVAITSLGMAGQVKGWFIPISVHPVCFGLGSIIKKPVVIDDKVEIREILNMSVLLDHDVIDGAPMARFISDLCRNVEGGLNLTSGV